eukprot:4428516-Lingulodinium_polyedra.AAC.1
MVYPASYVEGDPLRYFATVQPDDMLWRQYARGRQWIDDVTLWRAPERMIGGGGPTRPPRDRG